VGVEGRWELRDLVGAVVQEGNPVPGSTALGGDTLGRKVVKGEVKPPHSFALQFENGALLEVFDSKPEYESFSIPEQRVFV
jgi:hypothetical protein